MKVCFGPLRYPIKMPGCIFTQFLNFFTHLLRWSDLKYRAHDEPKVMGLDHSPVGRCYNHVLATELHAPYPVQ